LFFLLQDGVKRYCVATPGTILVPEACMALPHKTHYENMCVKRRNGHESLAGSLPLFSRTNVPDSLEKKANFFTDFLRHIHPIFPSQ
jgi:hypothetical protein